MRKKQRRRLLISDLLTFMVLMMVCMVGYFAWHINTIQTEYERDRLYDKAKAVERYLLSTVQETRNTLQYMGIQISQHDAKDKEDRLQHIHELFQAFKLDPHIRDLASWMVIAWVGEGKAIELDAYHGILKKPVDLSKRDYIKLSSLNPWKLFIGKATLGMTTQQNVIPLGIGITDKHGRWIGTLVVGLQLAALSKHIDTLINDPNITYALADIQDRILFESPSGSLALDAQTTEKFQTLLEGNLARDLDLGIPLLGIGQRYYFGRIPMLDYQVFVSSAKPSIGANLKNIMFEHLWGGLLFLTLILLGMLFLNRRVVFPIMDIAKAMQQVANSPMNHFRHEKVPLPRNTSFELFLLSKGVIKFNLLKERNALLLNVVRLAKDEAMNASKAKSEFLAYTAHELKNPLSFIINSSELMHMQMLGPLPTVYQSYIQDIHQTAQDLLRFMSDLLDQMQIETGRLAVKVHEWVDLNEQLLKAVQMHQLHAEQNKLHVITHIEPNLPMLRGDTMRVRQVFINLIHNAIKHSPKNTLVSVSAYVEEAGVIVQIVDQGPGINSDTLNQALARCEGAVSEDLQNSVDTAGLGLPLTIYLLKAHKATWQIDSAVESGTRFTICFPTSQLNT